MKDDDPSVSPYSEKKEIPGRGGMEWAITSSPSNVTITPSATQTISLGQDQNATGGITFTNGAVSTSSVTFSTTNPSEAATVIRFESNGNFWVRND